MNRRKAAVCLAGGALYALFAAFGWQAQHMETGRFFWALGAACVLLIPFSVLLSFLFRHTQKRKTDDGKVFFVKKTFAALLICYMPMFLIAFPGSFAYDVPFQLKQVFTGVYSTHHPLLHTLFLGGCIAVGRIVGIVNAGAALYTLLQMTLLALLFSLACASIARSCSARAAKGCALFFGLYPLHMMMAVNATKDVLFSGFFALTVALLLEAVQAERVSGRLSAGIVTAGMFAVLLRNNAVYAAAVFCIVALIMMKKKRVLVGLMALTILLGTGVNGILKHATHALDGDAAEMLSLPIQQMARARKLESSKLTEEEKAAVDEIMPGEAWRLYDPTISDPVKFEFDTKQFFSDVPKYLETYLSIGAKCAQTYWDALMKQTYSFFYPYSQYGVSGYYLQMGVSDLYYDDWCDFERITSESLMPRVLQSLEWRFGAQGAMQIPVVGWLFNMGLIVWCMFFFVLREAYCGRWGRFACMLLPVLLWGTFLLGPVMAGRYMYPFVCCLPILAAEPKKII